MLHQFVATNRDAIIAKTTEAAKLRSSPVASGLIENGAPRFLSQLSQTLVTEGRGHLMPGGRDAAIGESASRHGAELLALGFTVSQIVHVYGDICQAVTGIAMANNTSITIEEFQILNRCLDEAIAAALTEHARLTATRATMPPALRGLACPRCQSPTTEVVALRSSAEADEYHFRCENCNHQWSERKPPKNSVRVKQGETS
jgi:RNase P subunit RPR2